MTDDAELNAPDLHPPSAEQVARRALVLAMVSCRGILELDPDRDEAREFWERVAPWWTAIGLEAELEPEEAVLLSTPFGSAQRQASVNASWRSEALAVLGWALQRSRLPAHDAQSDPSAIASELGFFKDRTVLDAPQLRTPAELTAYASVAFSVHWRLRDFSLNQRPLDFSEFSKTAWFGPLSLEGIRLEDGDLAINGAAISNASATAIRTAMSIARERHEAANWLVDASLPLSETDTST